MIIWITGNSGSGKTTLAKQFDKDGVVLLDGDEMRATISEDCDLSFEGRHNSCVRVAKLAGLLESQGFDVVVSVIAPYRALRQQITREIDPVWIYLPGGKEGSEFPYEKPVEGAVRLAKWSLL